MNKRTSAITAHWMKDGVVYETTIADFLDKIASASSPGDSTSWAIHEAGEIIKRLLDASALEPAPQLPDIEAVAAAVHESWRQQKRAEGITSAPSQLTGEEQMRPYEELSQPVQEHDRATVRAVYAAIRKARLMLDVRRGQARDDEAAETDT